MESGPSLTYRYSFLSVSWSGDSMLRKATSPASLGAMGRQAHSSSFCWPCSPGFQTRCNGCCTTGRSQVVNDNRLEYIDGSAWTGFCWSRS